MPAAFPGNSTTKLARAAAGGGFESAIEVAGFTPLVADDFSEGTLGGSSADWTLSTYQNQVFRSGSQALELKTQPTQAPDVCGGDVWYGKRQALDTTVPLGNSIWQRIYMYIPSAFSFGYAYNKANQYTSSAAYTTGQSTMSLNEVTNRVYGPLTEESPVAVQLDDDTWHFTTAAAGTDDATKSLVLADALPSAVSAGNLVHLDQMAIRQECGGVGATDGGGSNLKWLVFDPNNTQLRIYLNATSVLRSVTGGGAVRRILIEKNSQSIDPIGGSDVPFPRDQWFALQMAANVSNTGDGWVRAWIDDQLVVERLNINTVGDTDTAIRAWGIGDYWNGLPFSDGQPGRDTFYIDDIIVASDMDGYGAPTTTDAAGNQYIAPTTLVGDL